MFINRTQALTAEHFDSRAQVYVNNTHEFNYFVLHATYSTSLQLISCSYILSMFECRKVAGSQVYWCQVTERYVRRQKAGVVVRLSKFGPICSS